MGIDPKDGGYRSRKMWMAYVVLLLISLGYLAVGRWETLGSVYPELIMGLLAGAGIYAGSNVFTKYAAMKNAKKKRAAPKVDSEPK